VNKFCIVTVVREKRSWKRTGLDSISASDVAEVVEIPFGLF